MKAAGRWISDSSNNTACLAWCSTSEWALYGSTILKFGSHRVIQMQVLSWWFLQRRIFLPVELVDFSYRTTSETLRYNMSSYWVWDPRMCLTHHWETVNLWLQGLNMHNHGLFFLLWAFPLPCNTVLLNHFISYQHNTRLPSGHTCISSVNRSFTLHVSCKHILRSSRYNYAWC